MPSLLNAASRERSRPLPRPGLGAEPDARVCRSRTLQQLRHGAFHRNPFRRRVALTRRPALRCAHYTPAGPAGHTATLGNLQRSHGTARRRRLRGLLRRAAWTLIVTASSGRYCRAGSTAQVRPAQMQGAAQRTDRDRAAVPGRLGAVCVPGAQLQRGRGFGQRRLGLL